MQAALWLLDGTSVPGLKELILALDGKVARRSGDRADGLRPLHTTLPTSPYARRRLAWESRSVGYANWPSLAEYEERPRTEPSG